MLKAQGAYEMPSEMVTSIFGENAKYADNTTCTVAENAENPVFPFTVTFDASKIVQNSPFQSFGKIKLIDTRMTTGTWILSNVSVFKPIIIVLDREIRDSGASIRTISGAYGGSVKNSKQTNSTFLGNTGNYCSSNVMIVIPFNTIVTLEINDLFGSNATLSAFQ